VRSLLAESNNVNYVVAGYTVTAVGLIAYTVSLKARIRRQRRQTGE
jgi:hypothetical protein